MRMSIAAVCDSSRSPSSSCSVGNEVIVVIPREAKIEEPLEASPDQSPTSLRMHFAKDDRAIHHDLQQHTPRG